VFAATVDSKVGGGGCDDSGGSGDGGEVSTRPSAVVRDRPGCSEACYAFAFHVIRDAFSAFFSRTAV